MSFHYFIDGYNLLYALTEFPAGSWEAKRESLLRQMATRKPQGTHAVTVVFDSREGVGSQSRQGAIQVVYTAAETADDWLARHVRTVKNPRLCVIVSDDKGLRHMIRGTGAQWMGTQEFWRQAKTPPRQNPTPPPTVDSDAITEELKKKWL